MSPNGMAPGLGPGITRVRFSPSRPMKTCTKCGSEKDLSDFAKNSATTDRLQKVCRECMKDYARQRYVRIKPVRLAQNKQWRDQTLERLKEYKQGLSCQDCGVSDWRVIEFDHLSDKTGNIADLVYKWSWKRLKEEIDKCEPVCANCHRVRTYNRQQLAVG